MDSSADPSTDTPTGESDRPYVPSVSPRLEYDSGSRQLTITHTAGVSVDATTVSIAGENLETGPWHVLGGETGGTTRGNPAIVAGDDVTLDADPDYLVELVWSAPEGDRSELLVQESGPEA